MSQAENVVPIQEPLFEVKIRKPDEGAISFSNVKNVALPHPQTAELLKDEDLGQGRVVSLVGGTGTIIGVALRDNKAIWTVRVEDVELDF